MVILTLAARSAGKHTPRISVTVTGTSPAGITRPATTRGGWLKRMVDAVGKTAEDNEEVKTLRAENAELRAEVEDLRAQKAAALNAMNARPN